MTPSAMNHKVIRSEVIPIPEYETRRPEIRERMIRVKEARRLHVGPYFTFLFENHDTMLYQIQEMVRAEGIKDETAIAHEIETYNALVGGPEEIAATLLIEITDPMVRAVKLAELVGIERHVHIESDGRRVSAQFDEAQLDPQKVSSVQYIRFPLPGSIRDEFLNAQNVRLVIDHPGYGYSQNFPDEVIRAVRSDLGS